MKEHGAFVVPTNVTFDYLAKEGARFGLPPESVAKIEDVREQGLDALDILHEAGVMMAYGSDLLGEMHRPPIGRVRPARRAAAGHRGDPLRDDPRRQGRAAGGPARRSSQPGAHADLIVVDGDPLADLSLLTGQGRHMPAIMKAGRFVKDELAA